MAGYVIFTRQVVADLSDFHAVWIILAGLVLLILAFHALIRCGLRAPRVMPEQYPDALGLAFETVRIPTRRGRGLSGWLIPAGTGAPALIVLHGWGGNSAMMLPLARPLHEAGYTLLFVDARSHGLSDGDSFSSMPRFAEDAESALAWLRQHPEADPQRIGLIGHSVGAAAVLLAASRTVGLGAVVSLAAFAHPRTMMRRWLVSLNIPWLPLGWYILRYVERTIGHRFDAIAPVHTIARVACPVLLIHGADDDTVPVTDAQAIHAAGHKQAELLVLPGGHDEFAALEAHLPRLLDFLGRHLGHGSQVDSGAE